VQVEGKTKKKKSKSKDVLERFSKKK